MRQVDSDDARALWRDNRFSQAKLVALQFLRLFIAAAFASYILGRTIHLGYTPGILIVLVIIFGIAFSPRLRKRSEQINQTFTENLAQRDTTE
jgi:cytochrome c biogenesis protein CcdA